MTEEKMVRIRVLPLKGIGGVGRAGDTAWMTQADADYWVKEGYVEILPNADEPVPSSAADEGAEQSAVSDQPPLPISPAVEEKAVEDHKIWKPQSKRGK